MFWRSKPKPVLEKDAEDWLLECWLWLHEGLPALKDGAAGTLITPTDTFFPPTSAQGHQRAEHIFGCVTALVGMEDWPFDLVPQDDPLDPRVGPLAVVQNAPNDPAGTFSTRDSNRIAITYSPDLVDQPINLIATFAHEVSHGLVRVIGTPPPGGWEFEEYATDLTTVLAGFGIFGANTAFEFRQFRDDGTGTQGWSSKTTGYLKEAEWAFALAVFALLHDLPEDELSNWLKPAIAKQMSKSMKYLQANPELLSDF